MSGKLLHLNFFICHYWVIRFYPHLWFLLRFMIFNFELQYVIEELNVKSLVPCNDTLKYASLRAEPDFRYSNLYAVVLSLDTCNTLFFLTLSLLP